MNELEQFKIILRTNNVSVTSARIAVFATLQAASQPLRTGEIARRTPSVNRASVYRTLELFTKLSITTTVIRGWTPFTELAEPFKAHHHHLICSGCRKSIAIENELLEQTLLAIATEENFTLEQHTAELFGRCADCRKLASFDK